MHIAFVCVVPRSVRHGGCPSCGGCAGRSTRERRAARALPGRAAVLSLSAPWQKSKRRDNDTPRSNSKQRADHRRFKVQKGRSKKVQGSTTRRAPSTTRPRPETAHRRHSAHGRPQPSVITIRYPSRSYVTRYSTRGSPVAHAGRCSDALPLGTATPRCSSRRRGVFGQGTMTQTHNHVGVVEWSVFPGISICVLHMWLRVS